MVSKKKKKTYCKSTKIFFLTATLSLAMEEHFIVKGHYSKASEHETTFTAISIFLNKDSDYFIKGSVNY